MFGIRKMSKKLDEIKQLLEDQHQPARLIEKYAKLESGLGIDGLLDFYNASPETFAMPPAGSNGRSYSSDYLERKTKNIPAFERCIQEFVDSSTDEVIYATHLERWPEHKGDFRVDGLKALFITESMIALHPGNPALVAELLAGSFAGIKWNERCQMSNLVSKVVHEIRGHFDYDGGFGVFVFAIPWRDAGQYFHMYSNPHSLLKSDVPIPAELIVGLVGGPTEKERALLDAVLRSYWSRLKSLGYVARPKYDYQTQGQNPFADPIPDMLISNSADLPKEIGLGRDWDARGTLEGWHRLAKINRIIAKHKA